MTDVGVWFLLALMGVGVLVAEHGDRAGRCLDRAAAWLDRRAGR